MTYIVAIVSSVISILALTLSVLSFRRSGFVADRQHAVSYTSDVAKWAAEVLETLPKAINMYNINKSAAERFATGADVANRLASLHDAAAFLLPDGNFKAAEVMELMIVRVREDTELIQSDKLSFDRADGYTVLRTMFIEAVRQLLGVKKRYLDAQKYLK